MLAILASGEKAGVYAIGEIITNPRQKSLNPEQEKYWSKKTDIYKFQEKNSVIVKYLKVVIDRPLLEDECTRDPILSAMQVLKNRQGTKKNLTEYEPWSTKLTSPAYMARICWISRCVAYPAGS